MIHRNAFLLCGFQWLSRWLSSLHCLNWMRIFYDEIYELFWFYWILFGNFNLLIYSVEYLNLTFELSSGKAPLFHCWKLLNVQWKFSRCSVKKLKSFTEFEETFDEVFKFVLSGQAKYFTRIPYIIPNLKISNAQDPEKLKIPTSSKSRQTQNPEHSKSRLTQNPESSKSRLTQNPD